MDLTETLKAFVATAQTGSFTAAAAQLGVSNRLTSKYVAELETRLGVRLLQRTTRRVGLTPAGEELLSRAPALLDGLDDLLSEVAEGSRGLTGLIRISAPVTFGELYLSPMLGRFAEANPEISIDLRLSDAQADLARDGIDLAFRIGRSEQLTLKSRKLGEICSVVAASPDYLAQHGTPEHPTDLSSHACILDSNRRTPRKWTFTAGRTEHSVSVNGRFQVNSASAAAALSVAGLGIAYGPRFALERGLSSGQLVPLLAGYTGASSPLNAVYLEGHALPKKLRALMEFAAEDLRQSGAL